MSHVVVIEDEGTVRDVLRFHLERAGLRVSAFGSTREAQDALAQADVLVSPASPGVAFPLGAKLDDPLAMYRQDLATIPSNLYGGPAMSLPVGLSEGLPVGLQVMAPTMRDELDRTVARMTARYYRELDPVLGRATTMSVFEQQRCRAELVDELPDLLRAVSPDQVRAAAATLSATHSSRE